MARWTNPSVAVVQDSYTAVGWKGDCLYRLSCSSLDSYFLLPKQDQLQYFFQQLFVVPRYIISNLRRGSLMVSLDIRTLIFINFSCHWYSENDIFFFFLKETQNLFSVYTIWILPHRTTFRQIVHGFSSGIMFYPLLGEQHWLCSLVYFDFLRQ